jgi:hypothetical protein
MRARHTCFSGLLPDPAVGFQPAPGHPALEPFPQHSHVGELDESFVRSLRYRPRPANPAAPRLSRETRTRSASSGQKMLTPFVLVIGASSGFDKPELQLCCGSSEGYRRPSGKARLHGSKQLRKIHLCANRHDQARTVRSHLSPGQMPLRKRARQWAEALEMGCEKPCLPSADPSTAPRLLSILPSDAT